MEPPHQQHDTFCNHNLFRVKNILKIKMHYLKQTPLPGLILFEGPLGAGKTTLISHLTNELTRMGYRVFATKEQIPDDLTNYYSDPKKYVYSFQKEFIFNLYRIYEQACLQLLENKCDIVLMDRWFYSTRAFFEYQHSKGWMTDEEYDDLMFCSNSLLVTVPFLPQLLVFLAEKPSICYQRVLSRGRAGEKMTEEQHNEITEYIYQFNRLCDKMYSSSSKYDLTTIIKHPRFEEYLKDLLSESNTVTPQTFEYTSIHPLALFTYETRWPLAPRLMISNVSYSRQNEHCFCSYIDDTREPKEVVTTILSYISYKLPTSSYRQGILCRPENLIHYQKYQTK